ncbi:solute carrier family 15 member 4 [Lingula anatina]|uniref:Solute carrier family 15 member 4 n=1 Tax=Lingula anatina TaxID=7574 RepID=A0A1S3I5F8_LINAN|nr:solute carrier family 15 member 4 [Lingula anatina]|eukprot:XP_013392599.1 solute carrier family 15 member 4 [Lingula anatina]
MKCILQWPVRENVAVAALALCVIGEACISPNLAVLGVTQLSKCEHNCELFMHMLYLSRNCGAFLVNTLLAFEIGLSNKGEYWKNFLPSLVATALAFVIYLTGLRIFKLDTKSEAGSETCRSFYLLASHVGWLKQSRTEQSYTLTSHIQDRKETAFDNLKKLVKIVLVNSSVFGFNIIYSQMLTTYGIQADSVLSPQHIRAPCAFMSSFNDTTVIILVAVILAMFSSRLRWRKLKVDLFSRMGIGLVCAVLSAFVAIVLEFERKKDCKANHGVSSLSVFVLIPQYAMIGLGEILTLVSGMQLAYLGAPKGLRCTSLGLLKTALGLGDFTAYGVLELLERFNPDWYDHHDRCMSLNLGRTDDYLLFLVGLLVGCFIFFLIVARYVSTSDRISSRTRRNATTLLGVTSQRTTSKVSVNNSNVYKEKD